MIKKNSDAQKLFENDIQYYKAYALQTFDYLVLFHRIMDCNSTTKIARYIDFFSIIIRSLGSSIVINICKLFDNDTDSKNIKKFLEYVKTKSVELFGYTSKNEVNSLIKEIQKQLKTYSIVLNKFKNQRDKFFAHFDPISFDFQKGSAYIADNGVDIDAEIGLMYFLIQSLYKIHDLYCSKAVRGPLRQFQTGFAKELIYTTDFENLMQDLGIDINVTDNYIHNAIFNLESENK